MTNKIRKHSGLPLSKANDRMRWMAGAMAAVGASATQAATFTLNNNFISGNGGNSLNADLTGDGVPDVTFSNIRFGSYRSYVSAGVRIDGVQFFASAFSGRFRGAYALAGHKSITQSSSSGKALAKETLDIPISFTDPSINGGALTFGTLEVTALASIDFDNWDARVTLDSYTYEPLVGHVPDGGSTLGLLALGAGGVIALRQRRKVSSQA